jgi:dTMP kinase
MSTAPAPRGSFVVIEGLDGSGKSTLAAALSARRGARCTTTPEPALRKVRNQVLTGLQNSQLAHQAFYLATVEAASCSIRAEVTAGGSVVLDRYLLSTMVYAEQRGVQVRWPALEHGLFPADATVFIDVPRAIRQARMEARGMSPADIETLDPAFDEGVRSRYLEWSRHRVVGQFIHVVLKGSETPEEVLDRVEAALGTPQLLPAS